MPKFGVQLSSIAPYLDTIENIDKSFEALAKMGCRYVQLQSIPLNIPDQYIAEALRNNGLTCTAVQEDYPFWFSTMPERAIERALICEANYLSFSMVPPQINTYDKLKRFATAISRIHEMVHEADLIFSYHPADMDFRHIGKIPVYDRLMTLLPEDVQLTFCVHSSFNRVPYTQILEKFSGRVDLVHFKDSITRADGAVQLMPLGEGDHNWQPVLDACVLSGTKYIFVEQENWDRNAFLCAEQSLGYLRSLKMN